MEFNLCNCFTILDIIDDKILIKDFGKLPSLRIMHFTDDDLQFYQDEIPPFCIPGPD